MDKENLQKIGFISLTVIVVVTIAISSWYFRRQINYTLQYKSLIQEQIDTSLVPLQKSLDKLELENKKLKITIQQLQDKK